MPVQLGDETHETMMNIYLNRFGEQVETVTTGTLFKSSPGSRAAPGRVAVFLPESALGFRKLSVFYKSRAERCRSGEINPHGTPRHG
jgi:hypothetical protein